MTMRSDEELFKLDDLWKYQLYLPQYNTHKLYNLNALKMIFLKF